MATPEQESAWKAMRNSGLARPDNCETCGGGGRDGQDIHARHDDYSKPLAVRWLCRSCHFRLHGALRKQRKDDERRIIALAERRKAEAA